MFAYHYPPENAIGGARPYRFNKYLSALGYRCQVFTAAEQRDLGNTLVEHVPDPFVATSRDGLGWQLERGVRKLFFPGALGFQWSVRACRSAASLLSSLQNAEVTVYSTYPPLGSHLAALWLVRNRPLKWIADFRDPVTNGGALCRNEIQGKAQAMLEKAFLERADAIIVNTDALERKWKEMYPRLGDRMTVIWNGYDPDDRIEDVTAGKREFKLLSHVGALYGGRSIRPLLESTSRLIDKGRVAGDRVRIRLVGPANSECLPDAELLERAKRNGWLEIVPDLLPQLEARRMAQESDGLLLIQPHSSVQVPAKLFEYLRLKRPILAYILPRSPIEEILRQSGANYHCVYANSRSDDIDSSLEQFLSQEEMTSETNAWFTEKFDGEKQAEELSALIRAVHGSRDPVGHMGLMNRSN